MSTDSKSTCSFAVVGGGMLGMTLALRLRQRGHPVTLFEGRDHLGGLADAWALGDVRWDRHYHVTLLSDQYLRKLLVELELDQDMRWVETKTGFYTDGQLYSMSNSLEFLRFPPLRLIDKVRLAATITLTSRNRNWRHLEQELVVDYLRRMSGSRTTEKIWLPLLKAKLGENYKVTSAAFIWATINRMYAARRSGLKKEMFGYLPGGYGRTLESLGKKLIDSGVETRLASRVQRVGTAAGELTSGVRVEVDGVEELYDRCILTVPSGLIPGMCPEMNPAEQALHSQIRYQGIICASMLLRRPLSKFYVTNITDAAPFTGIIEMTALIDQRELNGHHLVYLPKYVPSDSQDFNDSDQQVEQVFWKGLKKLYPDLETADVKAFQVSRAKYVMPIPTLGYSQNLPPRKSGVPGVFIVNGAQIVNGTLNVNETVKLAEQAIEELIGNDLGTQPSCMHTI